MDAIRPRWAAWSYLLYAGGFTLLLAAVALLSFFSGHYRQGKVALLAFIVFFGFAFVARALHRDGSHPIAAGVFGYISVSLFGAFLGLLWTWFGWLGDTSSAFRGFDVGRLLLVLLVLIAALIALRIFRFPLIMLTVVQLTWFFVTDLLSGGGGWSAIVTIVYGLILLAVAMSFDTGGSRIYGFWLHVVSGLTIGGGLLWFFHDGDFDWILIAIAALLYVALGDRLMRSSWVVIAAWGLFQVTTHFAEKWVEVSFFAFFPLGFLLFPFFGYGSEDYDETKEHMWAGPLSYAVLGLVFIGIALLIARRRRGVIPAAELL